MLFDQLTHPAFCHCFFLCFTVTLFLFFCSFISSSFLSSPSLFPFIFWPQQRHGPWMTTSVDHSVCQSIICTSPHIFVQTKISTTVGRVTNKFVIVTPWISVQHPLRAECAFLHKNDENVIVMEFTFWCPKEWNISFLDNPWCKGKKSQIATVSLCIEQIAMKIVWAIHVFKAIKPFDLSDFTASPLNAKFILAPP